MTTKSYFQSTTYLILTREASNSMYSEYPPVIPTCTAPSLRTLRPKGIPTPFCVTKNRDGSGTLIIAMRHERIVSRRRFGDTAVVHGKMVLCAAQRHYADECHLQVFQVRIQLSRHVILVTITTIYVFLPPAYCAALSNASAK